MELGRALFAELDQMQSRCLMRRAAIIVFVAAWSSCVALAQTDQRTEKPGTVGTRRTAPEDKVDRSGRDAIGWRARRKPAKPEPARHASCSGGIEQYRRRAGQMTRLCEAQIQAEWDVA
ncbi:hypothetical protein MA20_31250 [Bradyrhizobium japonicum]|uniref:Uncharacterized protein n=1 Tax=Bradyrhizobium japonicum TaxID=375 RepID=A0A0A3YPS7_BRAJP|nr:hypothetical protein MA20_31250 [Bradyrhizobium japonicum]